MPKPTAAAAADKVDELKRTIWAIRHGDVTVSGRITAAESERRLRARIARIEKAGRVVA